MAWTNSKAFRRYIAHMIGNVAAYDYDGNVVKAALFDSSITPDNDVTTDAHMSYNGSGSQWLVADEVTSSGEWDAGGVALASKTIDVGTADIVFIDAADTASTAGATLTDANGCLVYETVLGFGMCYNWFGGANSVSNGTFTIVWHANGIMRYTL